MSKINQFDQKSFTVFKAASGFRCKILENHFQFYCSLLDPTFLLEQGNDIQQPGHRSWVTLSLYFYLQILVEGICYVRSQKQRARTGICCDLHQRDVIFFQEEFDAFHEFDFF